MDNGSAMLLSAALDRHTAAMQQFTHALEEHSFQMSLHRVALEEHTEVMEDVNG